MVNFLHFHHSTWVHSLQHKKINFDFKIKNSKILNSLKLRSIHSLVEQCGPRWIWSCLWIRKVPNFQRTGILWINHVPFFGSELLSGSFICIQNWSEVGLKILWTWRTYICPMKKCKEPSHTSSVPLLWLHVGFFKFSQA